MREIRFRGKDISTGKWLYGSYIYQPVFACCFPQDGRTPPKETATRIYLPETFDDAAQICSVDPATVGQFTGLKDAKGVEIYEGDVVRAASATIYEVTFEQGAYRVKGKKSKLLLVEGRFYVVIGNVHDAPELLNAETSEK